jgi:hypothetical protein
MQYTIALNRQDDGRQSKGNWNMSFYQQLINEIDSLILNKGRCLADGYHLSFDELDECEQAELVVLQLEDDDRDTSDCFQQADRYAKDDSITSALIRMLKNINPTTQEDFANEVIKQSINRYRKTLSELIAERCGWVTKYQTSKGYDQ